MKNLYFLLGIILIPLTTCYTQSSTYIDDTGLMRWSKNKEEVCVFGTNYAVPFAYWDYRAPLIGDRYKLAIDEDVYHMARLGIDGYRIHVMESYITDVSGNLINNLHLELFDYLLFKLKERGIKMYITPMYLDSAIDGSFTKKYGSRLGCMSNEAAFPAQENYLKQFMNHVNPHTGIAYKDDADIIAFEIVNEPKHWKAPELIGKYIDKMYKAIRSAGCDKPLMYNMTTCAEFIDQVLETKIEGGSFQWYPTGLTSNQTQHGNMLPNVDQYLIPFQEKLTASKRPKFVYEFSPSDTNGSYMYAAMARSFREAGFQFAAHFSYDPMHAAHTNVEYKTHFLNLAYTPKKAIGFMIASEVFHANTLGESYGRFPENNRFEDFSLNYEGDLVEMNSETKFLYSNHTSSVPKSMNKLEQVAGTGNSTIVEYQGTGAYFLDKLEDGIWRLEVMPDAHWVKDPFFVPYTFGEVAVTNSKEQIMKVNLPYLGNDFTVQGLNTGNAYNTSAINESFKIFPGTYVISEKNKKVNWKGSDNFKNIKLNEFHSPTRKSKQDYVLHKPPYEVTQGNELVLSAKIIAQSKPEQVELVILKKGGGVVIPMRALDYYTYQVNVPNEYLKRGKNLRYHISYKVDNKYISYPGGNKDVHLLDRRIYSDDMSLDISDSYKIRVVNKEQPICLFDASTDWESITKMNRKDKFEAYPAYIPNKSLINIIANKNIKTTSENDYTIGFYFKEYLVSRLADVKSKTKIVIYGNALNKEYVKAKVSLKMTNGSIYGGYITFGKEQREYRLDLKTLKKMKGVLLPRPYPKFQSYWFESSKSDGFDISKVESIQMSLGENVLESEWNKNIGLSVGWILLK